MDNEKFYKTIQLFHPNLNAFGFSKKFSVEAARHPVYELYINVLDQQDAIKPRKIEFSIEGKQSESPRLISMDALSYVMLDQNERLIDFLFSNASANAGRGSLLLKKSNKYITSEDLVVKMIEKGYDPWLNLSQNGNPEVLEYAIMRDSLRVLKACVMHPNAKELDVEKFLLETRFMGQTFWEVIKSVALTEEKPQEYVDIPRFILKNAKVLPYKQKSKDFVKYLTDAPFGLLKVFYEEGMWPTHGSIFQTYLKSIEKNKLQLEGSNFFEKSLMFYTAPGSFSAENKQAWMTKMMMDIYPKIQRYIGLDDTTMLNIKMRGLKVDGNIYEQEGVRWSSLSALFQFFIERGLADAKNNIYPPKHVLKILEGSKEEGGLIESLEKELNDGVKIKDVIGAWYLCHKNRADNEFVVEKVLSCFNLKQKDMEHFLVERFDEINKVWNSLRPIGEIEKKQRVLLNLAVDSKFLENNTENQRIEWLKSVGLFGFGCLSETMAQEVHQKLMGLEFKDERKEAEFKVRALLSRGYMMRQKESFEDKEQAALSFEKFWPQVENDEEINTELMTFIEQANKNNTSTADYFFAAVHRKAIQKSVKKVEEVSVVRKPNLPHRF